MQSPASVPSIPTPVAHAVVGRYALHGKIASGGMATVYFGRMLGAAGFVRTVAIKRLHPHLADTSEFASMMIDEARLVARVHHPNVVQTIDVVSEGGEVLIVMQYVAGDSLAHLLRAESARDRRIPLGIASAVMTGALQGLHAAHSATNDRGEPLGIVHRDVSPHNLLVGVDGHARIIDFGVAKAAGRIQSTRSGVVKGKLPYMAPEQLAGQATSRRSDIYAAGIVLWEMLTGRRLFKADDDVSLFGQVLRGACAPPSRWAPEVPPALDAVVMRALEREPAARYATAREMADALVLAAAPALPTEVGAWVEDTARERLDQRIAHLSRIESQPSVPVFRAGSAVASGIHAVSAATSPSRSVTRIVAATTLALVAGIAASLALNGGSLAAWPARPAALASAATPVSSSAPVGPPLATSVAPMTSVVSAAPTAPAPVLRGVPAGRPKRHAPAKPSSPLLYATPD